MSTPVRRRVNADRRGRVRSGGQAATTFAPPSPVARLYLQRFLTVELVAYASIFVLSLAIRLVHLDGNPLDPGEAARALGGWQLIREGASASWREPLVGLSAALSFLALGDNDVVARLAPALVGSTLVLLPWLLRSQIGGLGALLASLSLSVSPSFVFYSRMLSADIFAAALSLGLFVCMARYLEERRPAWAVAGAILVALLLNAGASGLSALLIFAVFFALVAAMGKSSNEYALAWNSLKAEGETMKQAGMALIGVFVLVGSGFLGDLSGLRLPALSAWIAEFNLAPDGRPWYYHLQWLAGYEPLITLFGVAAATYYIRFWQKSTGRRALGVKGFLMFWAGASVLIAAFAGNKHGGQLLGPLLPLALLAGALVGELAEKIDGRLNVVGGLLLLAGAPFLVYAFLMVAELTRKVQVALWYQWTLVALALIMAAILIAAAITYGGSRVARQAALAGLAVLLGYSLHATWQTAFAQSEDRALAASSTTSRSLVDALAEIDEVAASRFLGKDIGVAVEPGLRLPIQWYLRNHTAVQYTPRPQPGIQAILWPVEPPPEVKLDDYFARQVVLASSWTGEADGLGGLWRWLLFGESPGKTKAAPIMLYLKK